MVEGTTLSEGRGTTRPFELFGAPDIDAQALIDDDARAGAASGCAAARYARAGSSRRSTSTSASSAPACRSTSTTAATSTPRSGRGALQALAFKALRKLEPKYPFGAISPTSTSAAGSRSTCINGSDLLRRWVDDRRSTPEDLDAPRARRRASLASRAAARSCSTEPRRRHPPFGAASSIAPSS